MTLNFLLIAYFILFFFFPSSLLFSEFLQKKHKQNRKKLTKGGRSLSISQRPGHEGAADWASLDLYSRGRKSWGLGAGWGWEGRGRSLKKIYIYCTRPSIRGILRWREFSEQRSWGQAGFFLLGPASLQGLLVWPAWTPQLAIVFWGGRGS